MTEFRAYINGLLRGPHACRLLRRCGIDPRRYWLLMDLFDELSDRGEMMDQLGRDGIALKTAACFYALISVVYTLALLLRQPDPRSYLAGSLGLTAFVLTVVLMSETGNSLVNPVEGLVLAHQPIDGATYTAAKLSHLLRIVLYFVVSLNVTPALGGLFLMRAAWWYPLLHLSAGFATGLTAACLCCALFGWLMRFVPPKRLRAAGQIAGTLPFLATFTMQPLGRLLAGIARRHWTPQSAGWGWAIVLSLGAAAIAVVALGLRSLSADYLIRVSMMMHGSPKVKAGAERHSRSGDLVARFFGGAPARAGFAFTRIMMLRDFQFRRQLLPLLIMLPVALAPLTAARLRSDPFLGRFTAMHLLPHITGIMLCLVCMTLPYGSDYKGVWVFLLAPDGSLPKFARGVLALLWIGPIAIPHVLLLPFLAWDWGPLHAFFFIAYSMAAASVFLALDLRLVDGVPFCKQADPSRGAMMMPLMIVGGLGVGIAVGLQWLLFRSLPAVIVATLVLGIAALFLTRRALNDFSISMRYHLGIATTETATLYQEVGA